MTTAYFQDRLQASLRLMNAAIDPCAKIAHEGMARGYRAILAAHSLSEESAPPNGRDGIGAGLTEGGNEFVLQRWTNGGGADTRGQS